MDPLRASLESGRMAAEAARKKRPRMSKGARVAARKRLPGRTSTGVPKTMPTSRQRSANGDMGLGNPNDVGAVIIPQ